MKMSYETYAFLKACLHTEQERLQRDFQIACNFIPSTVPKGNTKTGRDIAHKIFLVEDRKIRVMLDELRATAAATHQDHPNPDMRKFWGLEA